MDVHTHLTHELFKSDQDEVIARAIQSGLGAIIVNGLEPRSNREILEISQKYEAIKVALGIYPVDAVNNLLPEDFPFEVRQFDVQDEISFIRKKAKEGELIAIGECGLDGHWLPQETFTQQEKVFVQLIEIAMDYDLPVIIHTRKREKRSIEILQSYGVGKVNFHCFGGKTKMAIKVAATEGWYFSIPANARVNQAFTKLLRELPEDRILTETDAPYLGPQRNTRNEPANVVHTVDLLAELRAWDKQQAKQRIWDNYLRLFCPNAA